MSSSNARSERTVLEALGECNADAFSVWYKLGGMAPSSGAGPSSPASGVIGGLTASSGGGAGSVLTDKRLGERWEGVAIGEEASKFAFESAVLPRPNRFNGAAHTSLSSSLEPANFRAVQRPEVLPSVNVTDLLLLEKKVTRLESALRGVNFISSSVLEMEQYLASYAENQQAVRRALDTIDVKTETLYQQLKRQLGQSLDPEAVMRMCRRMEVLSALAPAINAAKSSVDALEAIVGEWDEVKKGAEMVVGSVEEHEAVLDQIEEGLVELEAQLESTEKNVAQTFDIFERELLVTARRYL